MANGFSVQTYSPTDVKLIVGGYPIAGWESISISRTVAGFQTIQGIRGKDTRSRNTKSSAIITIPILMTSDSNDVLSYIHELDLEQGTGRIVLTLKDNSGRSLFTSNEAYIRSYPETVFSASAEYRSWEIYCQTTETFVVGGNSKPVTSIFDNALNSATNFVSNIL